LIDIKEGKMPSTGQRVRAIIAGILGIDVREITNDSELHDFDLLPIDFYPIIEGIRNELKISIPSSEFDGIIGFKKVGDFVELVQEISREHREEVRSHERQTN